MALDTHISPRRATVPRRSQRHGDQVSLPRIPHPDPVDTVSRHDLTSSLAWRARCGESRTPGVRREALRCIPGSAGRNSEGGFWVAWLTWTGNRKGTRACQGSGGRRQASAGGVPQDPRDMAKAGLLQAQFPEVKVRTRRNDACNRRRVMPGHEPVGPGNFRGTERRPVRAVKEMSGRPTSRCHVQRGRTAGSPTGREPQGDGVPVVVAGATTCRGGRESRSQGEGAQVIMMSAVGGMRNAERRNSAGRHR